MIEHETLDSDGRDGLEIDAIDPWIPTRDIIQRVLDRGFAAGVPRLQSPSERHTANESATNAHADTSGTAPE